MNIESVPKVELHCHMDGILTPEMAANICKDTKLFPVKPEELQKAFPITDIASFFHWWDYIRPVQGSLTHYYPILARYIRELKDQNVLYTEIMIGTGELPDDPVEAIDVLTAFREFVNEQESKDIQVELLIAFGRQRSPEKLELVADTILALCNASLIVGIALAGPEIGYPVKPFHRSFARFHEAGLGIEIHAGEWCGPESIRDALDYGFPDRIGHGTCLFQDSELVDYFLNNQLHIEFCLSSNLKTGSITNLEEHPVKKAQDIGLNFSVNTDDPGPFECSMESEYRLMYDIFGFGEDEFRTIATNSLQSRFQPALRIKNPFGD